MSTTQISDLQAHIERLHGVMATHRASVPVREVFQGQTAWEGVVQVFDIAGHRTADTCYAWSSAVEGSTKRRFYAVLKIPPVVSPETAVRAAIVADQRAGRSS